MEVEKLVNCKRCEGNACAESTDGTITIYFCWGCGYQTSTLMKEGSKLVFDYVATAPDLYKDIMFIDQDKNVWLPSIVSVPEKGIVFMDGTDKSNAQWSAMKSIPLSIEESKALGGQSYKMDKNSTKSFGQDFMSAVEYIGMFSI